MDSRLKTKSLLLITTLIFFSFTLNFNDFKENFANVKKKGLFSNFLIRKSSFSKDNWELFTSKENGFSAKFPKKPEHSKQTIEIPSSEAKISYDTYVSEIKSDVVYVISVWECDKETTSVSNPDLSLQEGFSGMLAALPNSQVLLMRSFERQGSKALEFWIKNEDIFFRGELISVDSTLYQIFTVYTKESSKDIEKSYNTFINSFTLTKTKIEKKHTPSTVKQ